MMQLIYNATKDLSGTYSPDEMIGSLSDLASTGEGYHTSYGNNVSIPLSTPTADRVFYIKLYNGNGLNVFEATESVGDCYYGTSGLLATQKHYYIHR